MAQATHGEKVQYWARCYVDKWRAMQDAVRPHAPNAGVWFYAPFPSVAHVDPLDDYDPFLRILAGLGAKLTVFPFYYGIEYNQAEYMVRRWKDAGAERVVFLPMRDFMTKPSQFMRAVTAARRGQADGTCGFNFAVGSAPPEKQWQWKAVMMAALANFPTPELGAFCLIEEPAVLLEALAESDVSVASNSTDAAAFVARLRDRLPGEVRAGDAPAALTIRIDPAAGRADLPEALRAEGKGWLELNGATVRVSGTDATGVNHALELLLRFAELAQAERGR